MRVNNMTSRKPNTIARKGASQWRNRHFGVGLSLEGWDD
jgi:hypothetical protein